jgi:hypothetical protein
MIFHLVGVVTVLLIVAFFILFAAGRADGFAKLLGTVLGYWLVLIALLVIVGHVTAPMFGGKPFGMDMHGMHGGWMHHDGMAHDGGPPPDAMQPAAPPATVSPAPPAATPPAPAKPAGH